MRVLGRERLVEFRKRHADARGQIDAWLCEAEDAKWEGPRDIKQRYPTASFLGDNRVIFNVKGNRYRIDTKINYDSQIVLVIRVGTHEEYDNWDFS